MINNHARNFIIFSLARTGSTAIADIFNIFLPNGCLSEPFNPDIFNGYLLSEALTFGLRKPLEHIWRYYYGVKHVWNQEGWPFLNQPNLNEELLLSSDAVVIYLCRRNILKRVVSEEIARQSATWSYGDRDSLERRDSLTFAPLPVPAVNTRIENERNAIRAHTRLLAESGKPWMRVDFEDLFEEPRDAAGQIESFKRILDFVGFDPSERREVHLSGAWLQKFTHIGDQNKASRLYRQIPNIDDIESACGSAATGFLFQ